MCLHSDNDYYCAQCYRLRGVCMSACCRYDSKTLFYIIKHIHYSYARIWSPYCSLLLQMDIYIYMGKNYEMLFLIRATANIWTKILNKWIYLYVYINLMPVCALQCCTNWQFIEFIHMSFVIYIYICMSEIAITSKRWIIWINMVIHSS